VRVQAGEDTAELGAVGVAQVVEPVDAEVTPHELQVAGRADGVHVGQERTRVLLAGPGEGGCGGTFAADPRVRPDGAGDAWVEQVVERRRAAAPHRRRPADTARVEADDVVVRRHRARDRVPDVVGDHVDAGAAGAARVDHERPGPRAGRRVLDECELDHGTRGVAPVERRVDRGAGQVVVALRPHDRVRVARHRDRDERAGREGEPDERLDDDRDHEDGREHPPPAVCAPAGCGRPARGLRPVRHR
jgi:hypothetical protein